jgi:hypothetical protein
MSDDIVATIIISTTERQSRHEQVRPARTFQQHLDEIHSFTAMSTEELERRRDVIRALGEEEPA